MNFFAVLANPKTFLGFKWADADTVNVGRRYNYAFPATELSV